MVDAWILQHVVLDIEREASVTAEVRKKCTIAVDARYMDVFVQYPHNREHTGMPQADGGGSTLNGIHRKNSTQYRTLH